MHMLLDAHARWGLIRQLYIASTKYMSVERVQHSVDKTANVALQVQSTLERVELDVAWKHSSALQYKVLQSMEMGAVTS